MKQRVSAEKYVKPGDLIFFSGKGAVSWTIQLATMSLPNFGGLGKRGLAGFSHVGIAAKVHGQLLVYESTSKLSKRPPCVRLGIQDPAGVQAHYLKDVLSDGNDAWHMPLQSPLYYHEVERLTETLELYLGRGYDFLGAGWAWGGLVRRAFQSVVRPQNLDLLFCSELCAKALSSVGRLHARNSSAWNPNELARFLWRSGVCGRGGLISL